MTLIEFFFYCVGIVTCLLVSWIFFFRMVYHGIRIAGKEAFECIFQKLPEFYRNDFTEWDKLWLIPRYFRRRFFYVFKAYWQGWEIE